MEGGEDQREYTPESPSLVAHSGAECPKKLGRKKAVRGAPPPTTWDIGSRQSHLTEVYTARTLMFMCRAAQVGKTVVVICTK